MTLKRRLANGTDERVAGVAGSATTDASGTIMLPSTNGVQGAWNTRARTTTTTAAAWDYILANTTSGTFAITAPTPSAGKQFGVKWTVGTVAPTLSGTFNSAPVFTALDQAMEFVSDGTTWYRTVRPALAQLPDYPALTDARYAIANPTLSVTYNVDKTVASTTENGVTTTFTYNTDQTVATETRGGVIRTFAYNTDGTVSGAS